MFRKQKLVVCKNISLLFVYSDNKEETLKQLGDTRTEFQHRLDNLEKVANAGVKNAMIEEKKRYSTFVQIIRPFVVSLKII